MVQIRVDKALIKKIEQSEIFSSINTKTSGKNFLIDNESFEKAFLAISKGHFTWSDSKLTKESEQQIDDLLDEALGQFEQNKLDYVTQYEAYYKVLGSIQHVIKNYFIYAETSYFFLNNVATLKSMFAISNKLMFDYQKKKAVEQMILKNGRDDMLAIDEMVYGNGIKFRDYITSLELEDSKKDLATYESDTQSKLDRLVALSDLISKMHLV